MKRVLHEDIIGKNSKIQDNNSSLKNNKIQKETSTMKEKKIKSGAERVQLDRNLEKMSREKKHYENLDNLKASLNKKINNITISEENTTKIIQNVLNNYTSEMTKIQQNHIDAFEKVAKFAQEETNNLILDIRKLRDINSQEVKETKSLKESLEKLNNEFHITDKTLDNNINICFCSDEKLITFIPIVINSILRKNKNNDICIHYIYTNISDSKLDILKNFVSEHINLKLYLYHRNWDRKYKGLNHINSDANMLKLLIPDIIRFKKVIYLDIDLVVYLDLNEFYSINCGKTGIAMKKEIVTDLGHKDKINGNTGVMIMDLEILRKNNFTRECLKIYESDENLNDQYIINKYASGNFKLLAPRFNIYWGKDDYFLEKEKNFIFHYTGKYKPYNTKLNKYQYLWEENINSLNICNQENINLGILIYKSSYKDYNSSNIGDYIQSLATINVYRKIVNKFNNIEYKMKEFLELIHHNEIPNFNFIFIKRDNLDDINQYNGQSNIITVMNGWWMHPYNEKNDISFKIPPNITPIFVSFHIANDRLLEEPYIDQLKKYQPIGCRDLKTCEKIKNRDEGIDAYFSGCLTTTIDFFKWNKQNDTIFNIDTEGEKGISFSHSNHKWIDSDLKTCLLDAFDILEIYSKCKHVNTSRLNCYLPCLAMGVPVKLDTKLTGNKFDGLLELNNEKSNFIKLRTDLLEDTISKIINKIDHK